MLRTLLKSKLHRVHTTERSVQYVGSIGIDENLMKAADIQPYEKVLVADVNNGSRFETYAIPAPAGSGTISILGAAAHLVDDEDELSIFTFCQYTPEEAAQHKPIVIFVDEQNRARE